MGLLEPSKSETKPHHSLLPSFHELTQLFPDLTHAIMFGPHLLLPHFKILDTTLTTWHMSNKKWPERMPTTCETSLFWSDFHTLRHNASDQKYLGWKKSWNRRWTWNWFVLKKLCHTCYSVVYRFYKQNKLKTQHIYILDNRQIWLPYPQNY